MIPICNPSTPTVCETGYTEWRITLSSQTNYPGVGNLAEKINRRQELYLVHTLSTTTHLNLNLIPITPKTDLRGKKTKFFFLFYVNECLACIYVCSPFAYLVLSKARTHWLPRNTSD